MVEAFLIDESGDRAAPVSTDVSSGVGDYYVAVGNSITRGVGDDISADDHSADARNHSRGFTPILNDLLTTALGDPHTVEMEGVSGAKSVNVLDSIPSVLAAHPDAEVFLILSGTNDAHNFGSPSVPSGVGLGPGDPGFAGSYKDNMRQIVQAVIADGKEPLLSKVPIMLVDCSDGTPFPDPATAPMNAVVREYNQVIDELVVEFGIAVPPPDFYAHFEAFPGELADGCHPNGAGYQSMADLWSIALTP